MIGFVIIKNTDVCLVNHVVIAFNISGFSCFFDFVGDISYIIEFEQIFFVVLVDIRVFSSDIDSFYIGPLLFNLGYDFKAQVIKIALAAE